MHASYIEDTIINNVKNEFDHAANNFCVKLSTNDPHTNVSIQMTLYNYLIADITVERSTIFSSIIQSELKLPLFKLQLCENSLTELPQLLKDSARLRIPDKYLQSECWKQLRT